MNSGGRQVPLATHDYHRPVDRNRRAITSNAPRYHYPPWLLPHTQVEGKHQ